MRSVVLLAAAMLAAWPAVAADWLEGRFVSEGSEVSLQVARDDGGELVIAFEGVEMLGATTVRLRPEADGGRLVEDAAPLAWWQRAMGREAEALPFEGERLSFGHVDSELLVLSMLAVDARGRPTFDRFAISSHRAGVRVDHQRYTSDGLTKSLPVLLERVP